jgi:hypothetical protein
MGAGACEQASQSNWVRFGIYDLQPPGSATSLFSSSFSGVAFAI